MMESTLTAPMPAAERAEKSILSVMMGSPDTHIPLAIAAGITPEHFYLPGHDLLYRIMVDRHRTGMAFDLVTLTTEPTLVDAVASMGGTSALYDIYTYSPNAQHWDAHVRLLRNSFASRIAVRESLKVTEIAETDPKEAARLLSDAARMAQDALQPPRMLVDASETADAFLGEMEANSRSDSPGVKTGILPIDLITGGMRAGELWVVAAQSSGGKSMLMLQVASTFGLTHGKRVMIASLEMGKTEAMARMLSAAYGIPFHMVREPKTANKHYLQIIKNAVEEYRQSKVMILDDEQVSETGDVTVDDILNYARLMKITSGIDLLVVDYMQLVDGRRQKGENREQEVARVSRKLKRGARALGIPVITASQLNEQGQTRESRAILQDANVLLSVEDTGLRVAKNRNGKRGGLLPVVPDFDRQRFYHDTSRPEYIDPKDEANEKPKNRRFS